LIDSRRFQLLIFPSSISILLIFHFIFLRHYHDIFIYFDIDFLRHAVIFFLSSFELIFRYFRYADADYAADSYYCLSARLLIAADIFFAAIDAAAGLFSILPPLPPRLPPSAPFSPPPPPYCRHADAIDAAITLFFIFDAIIFPDFSFFRDDCFRLPDIR
jgi:hypothetical protein